MLDVPYLFHMGHFIIPMEHPIEAKARGDVPCWGLLWSEDLKQKGTFQAWINFSGLSPLCGFLREIVVVPEKNQLFFLIRGKF
jgi:hypothetical protein